MAVPWRTRLLALCVATAMTTTACAKSGRADSADTTGAAATANTGSLNRNPEVVLVPVLEGGASGWCLTVSDSGARECAIPELWNGPIIAEACIPTGATTADAIAVTKPTTLNVDIAGRAPIRTRQQPNLPGDLRGVVVRLQDVSGRASDRCPTFSALDARRHPISSPRVPGESLAVLLRDRVNWRRVATQEPAHLPPGVCEIGPPAPRGYSAVSGTAVRRITPKRAALGRPFTSCVSVRYQSAAGPSLQAAVLIDAADPGRTPAPLPGMRPVAGHPGVFQAPGPKTQLVARRAQRAWVVVEEGGAGLQQAVTLLAELEVKSGF